MSDENQNTTPNQNPGENSTPPEGQASEGKPGQSGGRSIDELPDWAKKELTDTRAEAANYRTKLREAEGKLAAAKTPEEYEAAVKELRESNEKLERDLLVSRVGKDLPDDLYALLSESGAKTEDELKAKADVLRKYAKSDGTPAPPGKLSGGLDPSDDSDSFDPADIVRKIRAGQL